MLHLRWILQVAVFALSLNSPGLSKPLTIDTLDPSKLNKDNPMTIKEVPDALPNHTPLHANDCTQGSEYSVEIRFLVSDAIVSGLK